MDHTDHTSHTPKGLAARVQQGPITTLGHVLSVLQEPTPALLAPSHALSAALENI